MQIYEVSLSVTSAINQSPLCLYAVDADVIGEMCRKRLSIIYGREVDNKMFMDMFKIHKTRSRDTCLFYLLDIICSLRKHFGRLFIPIFDDQPFISSFMDVDTSVSLR